ncbi:MAG: PilZ domain-containing protein [Thermodesulfobacteriota bacterium]
MHQKLYVYKGKAAFLCPVCGRLTTLSVSDYLERESIVHLACDCACGFSRTALLERRHYKRKETTLPGIYSRYRQGKRIEKIPIVVTELSLSGLRFKPHADQAGLMIGDTLWIKFNLSDPDKSLIRKEAKVVTMRPERQVGVEFRVKETKGPLDSFLFG